MLPLSAASLNTSAATPTVTTPVLFGVSVALYEVPLPVKSSRVPLLTVMSFTSKSVLGADSVKFSEISFSIVLEPLASNVVLILEIFRIR